MKFLIRNIKHLHENYQNPMIKKILNQITSTRAAGVYLLLFAFSIGAATFIENDFGTSSAQSLIFRSTWFEILLFLFAVTILVNIWRFRLIKQKKWSSLSFHLAIIIILIGAAITRYFGTEGMMHIREGQTSNIYLSADNYLKFKVLQNGKTYSFDEKVYFSSKGNNSFHNSYQIGKNLIDINLDKFIPNPKEMATPDPNGVPMIKVVIAGNGGREEYFVKQGDKAQINGVNFNFSDIPSANAFNVILNGDSLQFSTDSPVNQMVMATQQASSFEPGGIHTLMLRSLYTVGMSNFVIGEFIPKGTVAILSDNPKIKNESLVGLEISVNINGQTQKTMLTGQRGDEGQQKNLDFGDVKIALSYGAKIEKLPFSLTCNDFILEKYPGTENPSSYASEVTLIDPQNSINRDQRIYMNNILDYGGYKFFQSSFDQDELGTYLSVNHDFWGSLISYLGYAILTIGLIMSFFDKKGRFSFLVKRMGELQKTALFGGLILLSSSFQNTVFGNPAISKEHAAAFGKLAIQDHNGRVKPMNTFTGEILRKIARKENLLDQNSDQLILAMILNPAEWERAKIIQVPTHPQVQALLGTNEKMLSYANFFSPEGQYLLQESVRSAQTMIPKDQGTFEKAIIKLDEKVNIVNMIFSGSLFKIFPQIVDPTNTWITPEELMHDHGQFPVNSEAKTLFQNYIQALSDGTNTGNFKNADFALEQISRYQNLHGAVIMPSGTKLKAELLLNKLNVFNRLRNYYALLCLLITGIFLFVTIKKKGKKATYTKYAFYAMATGFAFHTIGLGLRWYISGRAPWSNGYESMIYIGWTTMLAGTLFSKKSLGGLAATATLAATILLVASMSWLDPEITPLVPVLKSYWLTIHVSLEAGSYGFLMLGAVIGMLNLLLMIFINDKNKENITRSIKELTTISEITLLAGLTMVSIGTYLGGVWANESWGRYWGWDAKETWALVTILVYAFILHMRFIPKLQSIYAFNFASLFGFATVIMTYFGVNYYLSGLHSYAAGDPVPIPPSVYYTALILSILSGTAYYKYKKTMA